ncbi:MAG TPA: histidine kinase dimerization/phospho-acceptor domain-containing protein, partial [Gaiellaceae bacterium]|nr:histidine kinase dimerization/phospho-acceptor domain-containing protein [Gaiellaceae bacterium]
MTKDIRLADLVSVGCHDILTPLATVYGFSRTLERQELEAPADRYVEMIAAAATQIGELVEQLR